MDDSREAIFITEVLQDGRATNILAMLTGSLVIATAVFSLLAAQAWTRSRAQAQVFMDGGAWATELDWRSGEGVRVSQDGSIEFGSSGGWFLVPFRRSTDNLTVSISVDDPASDLSRISVRMLDHAGQTVILKFMPGQMQLWTAANSPETDLLAWASLPESAKAADLLELTWAGGELQVACDGDALIVHPQLPFEEIAELELRADSGPPVTVDLSIRSGK